MKEQVITIFRTRVINPED